MPRIHAELAGQGKIQLLYRPRKQVFSKIHQAATWSAQADTRVRSDTNGSAVAFKPENWITYLMAATM
jgi:hypothetical protein